MKASCFPWLPTTRLTHISLLLGLLLNCSQFLPQEANAGFIETPGMGPKASAMGSAFAGLADDGYALFYNPAGLAQIKGTTRGIGIDMALVRRNYDSDGNPIDSAPPPVIGPRTVLTMDFGLERFTFGVGIMPSFAGFTLSDEFEGDLRYSGYRFIETVFPLFIGAGYQVNDKLCLGAVLQIGIVNKLNIARKMADGFFGRSIEVMTGLPTSSLTVNGADDGKMEIQTDKEFPTGIRPLNSLNIDDRSFSYGLGFLLKPVDKLQVGMTYREELRVHYEGEAYMELASELQEIVDPILEIFGPIINTFQGTASSGRFNALLKMPRQLDIGLAFFPTESLTITTDYVWTNWSTWVVQTINLEGEGLFGMTQVTSPMDFKDTHSLRMGFEYALTPRVHLRAGYMWDPTPVPTHTIFAGTADSDHHVATFGMGMTNLLKGRLRIEASFQYIHLLSRTIPPWGSQNLGGYKHSIGNEYNDVEFKIGGYALRTTIGTTWLF